MNVLRGVASEIYSMFAGDAVMSLFVVLLVSVAAALRFWTPLPSYLVGFGLLAGCLTLLAARVLAHARKLQNQRRIHTPIPS